MSANQFATMIAAMHNKKADVIPNGFKTSAEWAEIHGVSQTSIHKRLNPAVKLGFMEMKKFNIIQSTGLRSVNHYKIIKTK